MNKTYLFDIIYNGRKVGQTRAVSASKATTNYWWKVCKGGDKYAKTDYRPSDFTAVISE